MMTASIPSICVAICTRNRAKLLQRTIDALKVQTLEVDSFELLVVDNDSKDHTFQVFEDAAKYFPHARCVIEPVLGIANARNRAAREAKAQYLVYIDDDAIPETSWLEHLILPFYKLQPAPASVAGKVELDWEGGRPAWIPQVFESLYSKFDYGTNAKVLAEGSYLLTTNAAFNRQILLDVGAFRSDLGHRGKNLLGGEDNNIFNRLILNRNFIWYEPRALVRHWIPQERQTRRWLFRRVFWDGATQPLLDYGPDQPRKLYLKQVVYDLRRMTRFGLNSLTGDGDAFYQLIQRSGRLRTNLLLAMGKIQ